MLCFDGMWQIRSGTQEANYSGKNDTSQNWGHTNISLNASYVNVGKSIIIIIMIIMLSSKFSVIVVCWLTMSFLCLYAVLNTLSCQNSSSIVSG